MSTMGDAKLTLDSAEDGSFHDSAVKESHILLPKS